MTKTAARQRVDTGTLTWGDLKQLLDLSGGHADSNPSRVNPALTRAHAHDIFRRALATREDTVRVDPRSARDFLIAVNVLREFGEAAS